MSWLIYKYSDLVARMDINIFLKKSEVLMVSADFLILRADSMFRIIKKN